MHELMKAHYDGLGPRVVEALKKNQFDAYYCSTQEEAIQKALELIPVSDSVGWGGSVTLDTLGIKDVLKKRGNTLVDRDHCEPSEKDAVVHQTLMTDTFLMSSNAVTEDGQLYNVDGAGNRVAALCYGPKSVVVLAGMNKVVRNLDAAFERVKCTAAPANARRLQTKTPCTITGQCAGCTSPYTICANEVISRVSHPTGKIKVILIGEDLGL